MLSRILSSRLVLSFLAGATVFLGFEKFNLVPTLFLFAAFLNALAFRSPTFASAFRWGFLTSFFIMLGGFYWVVYVIHEFGFLPWWISVLLYVGFCGFGALNFPLYVGCASVLHRRLRWREHGKAWVVFWFAIALPALFTFIEFFVPKLFPWFVGHGLYRQLYLIQPVEWLGSSFLSFCLYSAGSVIGLLWFEHQQVGKRPWVAAAIPLGLWAFCLVFSAARLNQTPATQPLKVALIQANIGSLIKYEARKGIGSRVRSLFTTYQELTEKALAEEPKPDLIVWPETAMPFLVPERGSYSQELRDLVVKWKTPLITGGYAPNPHPEKSDQDFNAAFLLEPQPDNSLRTEVYLKNILLAFGEYMPLGDVFPKLYEWFPAVSHFGRGTVQNAFTLSSGSKLGITICYEAIVPDFYRRVAANGVNAVVNLTNDSWFGPTSEPYLHGSLTVFRAIETRTPLMRVTNTGTSFFVDTFGRMSDTTPIYQEAFLTRTVAVPVAVGDTLFLRWGDWFVYCCGALLLLAGTLLVRKPHAPLPV